MLDSAPSANFTVVLYDNPVCNASGFGEGFKTLHQFEVTTNASGHASFSVDVQAVSPGDAITATASPFGTFFDSEFSHCVTATGLAPSQTPGPPPPTPTPSGPAASPTQDSDSDSQ